MAILLGIDTGGTYTDAVLHDEGAPAPGIVAKAKALTTREDLSIGIGGAVRAVLAHGTEPGEIGLVSISTTLATNALVEGQGGRICLILIGFSEDALGRAGLGEAMGNDPVALVGGGHLPSGDRQAPLDREALEQAVTRHADDVDAFAVVSYFGTRDPSDEIAARELILGKTDRAVTCGHELASALGGPRRALTAVLNARLIGMISALIQATEAILADCRIDAPLMLVRGDGSLVSADFARARPIETILSGPAASLVGAAHLAGASDAVISDIGGTTTDIAILRDARPHLSPDGARVGGHHTMVEAVAMTTHGLGGDSAVHIDDSSLKARIRLGPQRMVPISLLAQQFPEIVHRSLDEQLFRSAPGEHDARLVLRNPGARATGLSPSDAALLEQITECPQPQGDVLKSRMQAAGLRRLVARGIVRQSGFTPSDAAHVQGRHDAWDQTAAEKAARLMARKRDAAGRPVAPNASAFSEMVTTALVRRSAEVLLDAALAHDGIALPEPSLSPLARAALDGHSGATRLRIGLDLPLVGLGASAPLYYPAIAEHLGAEPMIPQHADVANAIGAVVGQVRLSLAAQITQPSEGRFTAHLPESVEHFPTLEEARARTADVLRHAARTAAVIAGADEIELHEDWTAQTATIEGKAVFIEGEATITASGRPRLA